MIEKINQKIEEIRASLLDFNDEDNSLHVGAAGVCLFYSYDTNNEKSNENFGYSLNKFLEGINNENTPSTFCGGYAGVGWFIQHLIDKDLVDEEDFSELLLQIDEVSYDTALQDLEVNNHDFLHGAVGKCLYLFKRINSNVNAKVYLTELLHKIDEISIEQSYWLDNVLGSEDPNERKKDINIGLSHGLSSKIVLFSKYVENNIESDLAKKLLLKSVDFLMNHKNGDKSFSTFSSDISLDTVNNKDYKRMAWCYGDLGISVALYQAGEALNDQHIKNEATAICLKTTDWKNLEELGVVDPGICHGTAGICHIYNRMFFYTQNETFKEAADFWLNETFEIAYHDSGLAGYKAWSNMNNTGFYNDYSFLEGVAGIGLVLLNQLNNEEPVWDECLMLS